jgi:small neutral amino acid transporter SnatA (MarC family)
MSEFLRLALIFLAAVNPPAVAIVAAKRGLDADPRLRWLVPLLGAALAGAILLALALAADSLLDALDIAPESFRVAAGIVMGASGTFVVWSGRASGEGEAAGLRAAVFPLALPLLAGPAGLIAAISYGADDGAGKTIGAAVIAVAAGAALVAWRPAKGAAAFDATGRILGALLVVFASALAVSGVRDI